MIGSNIFANDLLIDQDGNLTIGISNSQVNVEIIGASGENAINGLASGTGAAGVYGENTTGTVSNYGILGYDNYGVYGYSLSGYAGYFDGDAMITGNLILNGTISGPLIGDITGVTAGTGLIGGGLTGNVFVDVEFAGTGLASTVARSDHDHNSSYSLISHEHNSSYYDQSYIDLLQSRITFLENELSDLDNRYAQLIEDNTTVPSGSFVINGGSGFSASLTVDLDININNAVLMSMSESIDFLNAPWILYSPSATYEFQTEGYQTLYMKFANSGGLVSNPVSASVTIDTDPTMALLSPADGAVSNDNQPVFDWSDSTVPNATYQVQIATDASFANIVADENGLINSSYEMNTPLSAGTYYWKARAIDESGIERGWTVLYTLVFEWAGFNSEIITFEDALAHPDMVLAQGLHSADATVDGIGTGSTGIGGQTYDPTLGVNADGTSPITYDLTGVQAELNMAGTLGFRVTRGIASDSEPSLSSGVLISGPSTTDAEFSIDESGMFRPNMGAIESTSIPDPFPVTKYGKADQFQIIITWDSNYLDYYVDGMIVSRTPAPSDWGETWAMFNVANNESGTEAIGSNRIDNLFILKSALVLKQARFYYELHSTSS